MVGSNPPPTLLRQSSTWWWSYRAIRDSDAVLESHEFGKHVAARNHRNAASPRFRHFGFAAFTADVATTAAAFHVRRACPS